MTRREEESGRWVPGYPARIDELYTQDEISLIDLWLVLVRRRLLIVALFAAFLIGGVILGLARPTSYTYTTSIEIARGTNGPLEQPSTVLAKLNESYIPFVRHTIAETSGQSPQIAAKIPKDSQIIVLESVGGKDDAKQHIQLHETILKKLQADHAHSIEVLQRSLGADRHEAENMLHELQDTATLLRGQQSRIKETETRLAQQAEQLRALIAEARKNRDRAVRDVSDGSKAMALLLIDNEMGQYLDRLDEVEERLNVQLKDDRDQLEKALADNQRAQEQQKELILEAEAKIADIKQTRAITPTLRSLQPTGVRAAVIASLAAALGLLVGVFAAFGAEFLAKARERMQQAST